MKQMKIEKASIFDEVDTRKYFIFDIETTGLSSKEDDIIEIAGSVMQSNRIIKEFHSYVSTQRTIPKEVTAINKIDASKLTKAPECDRVLNQVYSSFSDCIFVAHNAHSFDAQFILNKANYLFLDFKFLDTKLLARKVLPGLQKYSMTSLCNLFGIEIINQHTAKGDVDALVKLFRKLIVLLDKDEDVNQFIKTGHNIKK